MMFASVGSASRAADPQPYSVKIAPTGNAALDSALNDASELVSLRQKAPVPPFALISRARADEGRLQAVLSGFGYYDGAATVRIDDRPLDDPGLPGLLQSTPKGKDVPVTIAITEGPLYHLRRVTIQGTVTPDVRAELAPVAPGAPAVASDVLAAQGRMLTQLRKDGHALAKVPEPSALADRATKSLDITYTVDAGPRVDIGPVSVAGLKGVNADFIQRRLLIHAGQQFNPDQIDAARQDLQSLGVFSSVTAEAAPALNAQGTLPITFQVIEAPKHAVTLGASYSTDLGIQGSISWKDRNLFGNAEQLILTAENTQLGGSSSRAPGFDISAEFIKPDFLRRDQTLDATIGFIDENLEAYERRAATESVIISRKLSPHWTVSIGEAGEAERILQEEVVTHYGLIGIPIDAKYDSTDSLLDPTTGIRADINITPTGSFPFESSRGMAGFAIMQASGSTYINLGAPGRSVLALRGLIGSAQGASALDLPPDKRFYAGGSATVRGFKYQSVGPQFADGVPEGGLAIDAATVEFRQRLFGSFGAVVFVDAGQVSRSSAPFTGTLRIGAGAGVRYYSPLGPIRVDVAVPVNREKGGDTLEAYIGLGQAF
jgi:translocation and assembly module TamA